MSISIRVHAALLAIFIVFAVAAAGELEEAMPRCSDQDIVYTVDHGGSLCEIREAGKYTVQQTYNHLQKKIHKGEGSTKYANDHKEQ